MDDSKEICLPDQKTKFRTDSNKTLPSGDGLEQFWEYVVSMSCEYIANIFALSRE